MKLKITAKILLTLMGLSLISLAVLTFLAAASMEDVGDFALDSSTALGEKAVTDSTKALRSQAEDSLLRLAGDQAAIAEAFFQRAASEVEVVASYSTGLWRLPPPLVQRRSYSQTEKPADERNASAWQAAPGVDVNAEMTRIEILANLDDVFIPIFSNDSNLATIYIGTKSGIFKVYPWMAVPPEYDCRTRPWFTRAAESGKTGWTEPYIDAAGRGLMITCSTPIYSPERLIVGTAAADISLQQISQGIIGTRIGQGGYAFLIDGSGKVLSRPGLTAGDKRWDESFQTENILLSTNAGLTKIAINMIAGQSGVSRVPMDGGDKYIAYAPIKSTGWSIGVVMPIDEIIAPATATEDQILQATRDTSSNIERQIASTRNLFIGILLVSMVIICGIAYFLARRITRPILVLNKGAGVVGGGNLDYRLEIKTGDEIEDLAKAFNKMTADLKVHIAELQKTTAARERIESELRVATEIQTSMLPRLFPPFPGRREFEIYATMQPAREVGGDFYDFFFVRHNKLCFTIGDVCGKGIAAALFMAITKTLLKTEGMSDIPPDEILTRTNNILVPENDASMFATVFCGILDTRTGELAYANAGHLPPLLSTDDGVFDFMKVPKGLAIGPMEGLTFQCQSLFLKPGDAIFLYTDGVTEAADPDNKLYSEARLRVTINRVKDSDTAGMIKTVHEDIVAFARGAEQADDITMLALRFKGQS
ncbi:MAG: SpoIIE family protein phosphatase [Chloroflexota bacterium]